jgi:hypothetical protein
VQFNKISPDDPKRLMGDFDHDECFDKLLCVQDVHIDLDGELDLNEESATHIACKLLKEARYLRLKEAQIRVPQNIPALKWKTFFLAFIANHEEKLQKLRLR